MVKIISNGGTIIGGVHAPAGRGPYCQCMACGHQQIDGFVSAVGEVACPKCGRGEVQIAIGDQPEWWQASNGAKVCRCTMREKLVGDGCEVCNRDWHSLQESDDGR